MLTAVINRHALEALAGGASFRRGEAYFAEGAVGQVDVRDNTVTATVAGTAPYRVKLWNDDGELAGDCTCPRATAGSFCKHCVAVGLAWLAEHEPASRPERGSRRKQTQHTRKHPWETVRRYLEAQTVQTLSELLLHAAERDDRLFRSLALKAELTQGAGHPDKNFRRAIDKGIRVRGFLDWRESASYAARLHQLVDSLAELLQPPSAALLVELAEHAIVQLEKALERIDDSNGEVGDVACRLGELHFRACDLAKPDPVTLAERLFRLETGLPFGVCSFSPATYAAALGERGFARYRELAEAEWRKLGPLTDISAYDAHRASITRIMEQLAEARGDIDELVAIMAKTLSSSARYLRIAEILTEAKRSDEALVWAERGLKAFPDRAHDGLRDFLVAAYLKRGRNDEALQLTWNRFEKHPGLETYEKLRTVTESLGIWPAQRERALRWLDQAMVNKSARPDHSVRLSIALWEGDLEAAWDTVQRGHCERQLTIDLAQKLEKNREDDAITLYRRVVPFIVGETHNAAYEEGVHLIRRIATLMKRQGKLHALGDYLAELRVQFKPKRNFIRLLDGVSTDFCRSQRG